QFQSGGQTASIAVGRTTQQSIELEGEKLPAIDPSWAVPRPGMKKQKPQNGDQASGIAGRELGDVGQAIASESIRNSRPKNVSAPVQPLAGLPQPLRIELGTPPTPSPATIIVPPKTLPPPPGGAEKAAERKAPVSTQVITVEKALPAAKPPEAVQRPAETRPTPPAAMKLSTLQQRPENSIALMGLVGPIGQEPPLARSSDGKPTRLPPISAAVAESTSLGPQQKSPSPLPAEILNPNVLKQAW